MGKLNHTVQKLGAMTMILWPIIKIDHQRRDMGEARTDLLPQLFQAIGQTITGHTRCYA